MTKSTFVSLSLSCQTAHQLAHFCDVNPDKATFQKGPFDWLICPPENAAKWLNAGLPDFEKDEITIHRNRAYWERFGFWFWHGFMTKADDEHRLEIEQNAARELAKLAYQRKQFRSLDPAKTVFVASNTQNNLSTDVFKPGEESHFHFTHGTKERLRKSLETFFDAPVNLHTITRPDRSDESLIGNPKVHHLPSEDSEWKGAAPDWDAVLKKIY